MPRWIERAVAASGARDRRAALALRAGPPRSVALGLLAAVTLVSLCIMRPALSAGVAPPLPRMLSETGLFAAESPANVREGTLPFSPQYPLWSDHATKRRWFQLPPGATIDATRPDAWVFPRGTRLWKEFSVGRPVETRLIERLADGSWRFATYVWKEDGSDAVLAPPAGIARLPVRGAPGGRYQIPGEADCRACHEGPAVPVLGMGALQLSPDRDRLAPHAERRGADDVDLRSLVDLGLLRNLPQALLADPPLIAAASPVERAALGYLHANCGHCHGEAGDGSGSVPVELPLSRSAVTDPGDAHSARRSLVGAPSRYRMRGEPAGAPIVAPGNAARSTLVLRMRSRDPLVQMPPLGTAIPDHDSLALIERWIDHDLKQPMEKRP
jgi:hypothetical protein